MNRWQLISVIIFSGMGIIACSSLPFSTNGNSASQNGRVQRDEATISLGTVDADFAGRVAVIDRERNLSIYESGQLTIPITTDAQLTDSPFDFNAYDHPTWSPEGWLSYVQLNRLEDNATVTVYALRPGETEAVEVLSGEASSSNYIYGYWSPTACGSGSNCGRFAYLMGERGGISLHLAEINSDDTVEDRILSEGNGSLYYSWAPSGEAMLWNRNATDVLVYDVAMDEEGDRIDITPGPFQAPGWSTTDRFLYARVDRDAEEIALTVTDDSGDADITSFVNGTFFNWSPLGDKVAFTTGVELPLNSVRVIDEDGGNEQRFSEVPNVVAFFWSPDGNKLAIVGAEQTGATEQTVSTRRQQATVRLVWYVADIDSGEVTRLSTFFATPEQSYLLSFFDQYAQSHRVWSPDSRHIVYADTGPEFDNPRVFLLDTENPDDAPVLLKEGVIGVFSFN